jgi:peptidase M23-like protein
MSQRVQIQIIADATQAQGIVDALNKNLGNIGGNAFKAVTQNVNQLSASMLNAVQVSNQFVQAGYRLTVGLSGPIIAAATYVTKLGAELESARAAFEVFTGSVSIANKHLEDLKQLALSSALDFKQILSLSRYLQASGIEAAKVIPLLKSVGNALIVSGDPGSLETIVRQLVRIQNLGRVTLRELNPLARAGIPVFDELKEAIRRPGEEADRTSLRLKNLLKAGNIPGPEFINFFQAIQNVRFPGGLEKTSATLKGQFQELTNAITIAAGNLGEALAPAALLVIKVLTDVVRVANNAILAFKELPAGVRILVGLFIGLLAVIGPLILAFGYVSRALLSTFNLFQLATGSITRNNIATSESVIASNAAAVAKTREAVATELVAKAVQSETRAKAEAPILKQLPLLFDANYLNKSGRLINSAGRFVKKPGIPASVRSENQLGLFDNLATSSGKLTGTGATDDIIAAASSVSLLERAIPIVTKFTGVVGIAVLAAATIYNTFKAFGELTPKLSGLSTSLDSIGISFSSFSTIVSNSIDIAISNLEKFGNAALTVADKAGQVFLSSKEGNISKAITDIGSAFGSALNPTTFFGNIIGKVGDEVERLKKDIDDFKQAHPEFNVTKSIAESGTSFLGKLPIISTVLALAAPGAQKSLDDDAKAAAAKQATLNRDKIINQTAADAAGKALRDKQALNEAEVEYAKTLQLTEQGNRSSSEVAILAEGKEFGGLKLINAELDKQIYKLTQHEVKVPGSDLTEIKSIPLSNIEQYNLLRTLVANTYGEIKKTQKEVADAGAKVDEEGYKLRISSLEQFARDKVSRLQALVTIDESSTLDAAKRTSDIEKAAAVDKAGFEDQQLLIAYNKTKSELAIKLAAQNAPDNIKQRASILTAGNTSASADQIASYELAARQVAINQIGAQSDFADKDFANKRVANKNALNSTLYNTDLAYVKLENTLFKEANDTHIAATSAASVSVLGLQKQVVDQTKQAQLSTLEFRQPVGLKETLDTKNQQLAIIQSASQQETVIAVEEAVRRNEELRRIEEAALDTKYRYDTNGDRLKTQALVDFDKKANQEVLELTNKGIYESANNIRQNALEQFQAVKENAISVFDSIKGATRGLLDELFDSHKTKTFGQIIGDTIKNALTNVAKDFLSSQISAAFTGLATGQKVSLKSPGGLLGAFFGGGTKPVIGSPGVPITPGGITLEEAEALSASARRTNLLAAATPAFKIEPGIPSLSAIPNSNVLEAAAQKYGKEGILGVVPNGDGSINVVVKRFEAAAKQEATNTAAMIASGNAPESEALRNDPEHQEAKRRLAAIGILQSPLSGISGPGLTVDSNFGLRDDPNNRGHQALHKGIDYGAAEGTVVLSSLSGTVDKVNQDFKTLGNSISIFNKDLNTEVIYGHLKDKPLLAPGTSVLQGSDIGKVGHTGNATGSSLHFETLVAGVPVDPNSLPNALKNPTTIPTLGQKPKLASLPVTIASDQDISQKQVAQQQDITVAAATNLPLSVKNANDVIAKLPETLPENIARATAEVQVPQQVAAAQETTAAVQAMHQDVVATVSGGISTANPQAVSFPFVGGAPASTNIGIGSPGIYASPVGSLGGIPTSTAGTVGGFNVGALLPGAAAGGVGGIILGAAVGAAAGTAEHFSKAAEVQRAIKSAYGINVDPKYAQAIYDNVITPKYQGNIQAGLRDPSIRSDYLAPYAASGQGRSGIGTAAKSFFTQGGALATGTASLPLATQYFGNRSGGQAQDINGGGGINFAGAASAIPGLGVSPGVSGTLSQFGKQFGGTTQRGYSTAQSQQIQQQGFAKTFTNFIKGGSFLPKIGSSAENIADTAYLNANLPITSPNIPGGLPNLDTFPAGEGPLGTDVSGPYGSGGDISSGGAYGATQTGSGEGGIEGSALPSGVSQIGDDAASSAANGVSGAFDTANSALSGIAGNKAISGLATGLGLGLFSAGLSQKSGTGVGSASLTTGGGALAGFGLSKQLGLSPLVGLGAGAGIGLLSAGVKRGGAIGIAEDTAGGALTGASIGAQFGGPIGAGIGAAVGAVAGAVTGVVRLFVKGAAEKVQGDVKTLYNLTISRQYAQSIYDTVIKPKYGGNIEAGIRSKDVLDMLALYSSSTGQKFGIANVVRPLQLIQTGTGLTQAANYQNNQALSFANLGVYGGTATQTILSPQHLSTGGLSAYQQLPGQGDAAAFNLTPTTANGSNLPTATGSSSTSSGVGTPANSSGPIIVENKLPSDQVGAYFDGRTVRTIANNPATVSSSVNSAYGNNTNRRSSANLLVSPNELLT